MKKFSKFLSTFLCLIIIVSTVSLPVLGANEARYDLPLQLNTASYLLASLDTGEIIFEKDSHAQRTPASLTKMLTAYVTMKYITDLDGTMITAPRYVYDELFGQNSSTADIRQGEVLSARQLLYALLLPSANEAANILADYIGNGSIPNFCMMMNSEAKKLGCTDTNFSNAHGLFPDNHYTSAYDMYLIAKACYETPGFMDIVTTKTYEMPANVKHTNPYYIQSTVKMQNKAYPDFYRSYVKGMKTGSLDEAGHNFVTVCEKNGERYILVVMGVEYTNPDGSARSNYPAFEVTAQIMDYFFENYTLKSANTLTSPVIEIPLKYAKDVDSLLLYADNEVMSVLPKDVDETSFQKVYNLPEFVGAPIKAGDVIGTVDYFLAGQKVGTSQLASQIDVKRSLVMFALEKIQEVFRSLYFKVVVAVTLILIGIYAFYAYKQYKKHEKMQKVHRSRR